MIEINAEFICSFLASVIRVTTPLFFISMATLITRKAGLLNMASESMMLAAALSGVIASGASQSLFVGALFAVLASVVIALIICYCAFNLRTDLYLTSIAVNTALSGGTVFVMYAVTGDKLNTLQTISSKAFGNVEIPLIKDIPYLGTVLSGHNVLTYLSFIGVVFMWFFIYKTTLGLRIRSVGENPAAAESVGIKPRKIYYISFLICAVYNAFTGMYMAMGYLNYFLRDMMGGRGFIGMSAMNIAEGRPFLSILTSLMFGFAQALSNYLQLSSLPTEIVSAFPFLFTVVILLIANTAKLISGRNRRNKIAEDYMKRLQSEN